MGLMAEESSEVISFWPSRSPALRVQAEGRKKNDIRLKPLNKFS